MLLEVEPSWVEGVRRDVTRHLAIGVPPTAPRTPLVVGLSEFVVFEELERSLDLPLDVGVGVLISLNSGDRD